jgi:hypothetical protein
LRGAAVVGISPKVLAAFWKPVRAAVRAVWELHLPLWLFVIEGGGYSNGPQKATVQLPKQPEKLANALHYVF